MLCVKLNSEEANSKDIMKALKWCEKKGFDDIGTGSFCGNVTWWSDLEYCGNEGYDNTDSSFSLGKTIFTTTFKEFKKEVKKIIKGNKSG